MAQSKQGIHNSMLLECVKFDAESITLSNVEGDPGIRSEKPEGRTGECD